LRRDLISRGRGNRGTLRLGRKGSIVTKVVIITKKGTE
jgi:hypothetical protein